MVIIEITPPFFMGGRCTAGQTSKLRTKQATCSKTLQLNRPVLAEPAGSSHMVGTSPIAVAASTRGNGLPLGNGYSLACCYSVTSGLKRRLPSVYKYPFLNIFRSLALRQLPCTHEKRWVRFYVPIHKEGREAQTKGSTALPAQVPAHSQVNMGWSHTFPLPAPEVASRGVIRPAGWYRNVRRPAEDDAMRE
jgi:hypothetical protein